MSAENLPPAVREQLTRLGEKKPRPTGIIGMDKKRFQESQEKSCLRFYLCYPYLDEATII